MIFFKSGENASDSIDQILEISMPTMQQLLLVVNAVIVAYDYYKSQFHRDPPPPPPLPSSRQSGTSGVVASGYHLQASKVVTPSEVWDLSEIS